MLYLLIFPNANNVLCDENNILDVLKELRESGKQIEDKGMAYEGMRVFYVTDAEEVL